jgi:hypothetical protein
LLLSRRNSYSTGSSGSASDDEVELRGSPLPGGTVIASAHTKSPGAQFHEQPPAATDPADAAREQHDIFNLVALVRHDPLENRKLPCLQ